MTKKFRLAFCLGCLASITVVTAAQADTDMDWEISDALDINNTTGTGTAYQWRIQRISLSFDVESRDGVWSDGRPYVEIKGTDASPFGHCLQLAFTAPLNSGSLEMRVKDHGSSKQIYAFTLSSTDAHAIRLWVNKNAGGSGTNLPWTIYMLPGQISDAAAQVALDIRRIEVDKANCATNPVGDPWIGDGTFRWPWATIEGYSSSYTVTTGHF
jgi:hypothetical protein